MADAASREMNRERDSEVKKAWYEANREHAREKMRKNYRRNRSRYIERARQRELQEKAATPAWLTDSQRAEIDAIYKRAADRSQSTGVPHEVDHIEPLQGDTVCGLHVPWNLQILTRHENRRKHNRL